MPLPKNEAWFPAKTHGWGWGPPRRWQGWVVMVAWAVALVAGGRLVKIHTYWYVLYALFLGAILTAICYWKGEKPGWRWSD
jgi:hypothetical protein